MIVRAIKARHFASNCYVVGSEATRKGLIIDPADVDAVLALVGELGLSISLMVATHTHIDHIFAVRRIKEKIGTDFAVHEAEGPGNMQLLPEWFDVFGLPLEAPPNPDRLLRQGDVLEIGDLKFSVLHTPGHSPGSISLAGKDVVFTGDTLLQGNIGRTDLPGGNYAELMESIRTRLMGLPDDTLILPGHGPQSTVAAERERLGLRLARWNIEMQGTRYWLC